MVLHNCVIHRVYGCVIRPTKRTDDDYPLGCVKWIDRSYLMIYVVVGVDAGRLRGDFIGTKSCVCSWVAQGPGLVRGYVRGDERGMLLTAITAFAKEGKYDWSVAKGGHHLFSYDSLLSRLSPRF